VSLWCCGVVVVPLSCCVVVVSLWCCCGVFVVLLWCRCGVNSFYCVVNYFELCPLNATVLNRSEAFNYDLRSYTLNRVIAQWNSLPDNVVSSTQLDKFLHDQNCCKFTGNAYTFLCDNLPVIKLPYTVR